MDDNNNNQSTQFSYQSQGAAAAVSACLSSTLVDGTCSASTTSVLQIPSVKESQRIIANAMSNLSFDDRNRIMEEVHGIGDSQSSSLSSTKKRRRSCSSRSSIVDYCYSSASAVVSSSTRSSSTEPTPTTSSEDEDVETSTSTPLSIQLQQMGQYLESHKSFAYQIAEKQSSTYILNRDLRLSFLLGTEADTTLNRSNVGIEAGKKLNRFLDQKQLLFGKDALGRPISIGDLDDDDMTCLKSGYLQEVGFDASGRTVVGVFPTLLTYKNPINHLKAMFYFWMSIFPEHQSYHRRVVVVYYNSSQYEPNTDIFVLRKAIELFHSLPIHVIAHHVALNPSILHTGASLALKVLDSISHKARYCFHFGQDKDIQYELASYGIDTSKFPINLDGEMNLQNHEQWFEERRLLEENSNSSKLDILQPNDKDIRKALEEHYDGTYVSVSTSEKLENRLQQQKGLVSDALGDFLSGKTMNPSKKSKTDQVPGGVTSLARNAIIVPTHNDVLFGRGTATQNNPGNVAFRKILERNLSAYSSGDDTEKRLLVDLLSHHMTTKLGIRFLKASNDGLSWTLVDDKTTIRNKFYHTFRSIRAANRRLEQKQK